MKKAGFIILKARDIDLGSGHTAHRRASLINLYRHAKFHWNRKNFSWTDIWDPLSSNNKFCNIHPSTEQTGSWAWGKRQLTGVCERSVDNMDCTSVHFTHKQTKKGTDSDYVNQCVTLSSQHSNVINQGTIHRQSLSHCGKLHNVVNKQPRHFALHSHSARSRPKFWFSLSSVCPLLWWS